MRLLSEFSIKKPATATMIIISMIFFGLLGLSKMRQIHPIQPLELLLSGKELLLKMLIK